MRAHRGQVALYLIAVLVAICILTIANVGIYLAVSARNKTMNAGDAAAIAVAKYQGELLNRIGQMNIDHLTAALENDEEACEELMEKQLRICFLGPISGKVVDGTGFTHGGITAGNELAKENGAERNESLEALLMEHAKDVRTYYASTPDVYPAPWDGAWEAYAEALEEAVGEGLWAGPDNINFVDAQSGHTLLDRQFYSAVEGQSWCWFKFNAPGLLDSYGSYLDWPPLPMANDDVRMRRCVNSEIYSLNLHRRIGSAVDLLGTELICRLTGATAANIANSYMITNRTQAWMFYDSYEWERWWQIDPHGEWQFPVVGSVKREYDVRGCAALCRTYVTCKDLVNSDDGENAPPAPTRHFTWTAAAKPFGTVENEDGEVDVVTANNYFVTPAFTESHLVPIDAVGGKDLATADAEWLKHVRKHLPQYLASGRTFSASEGCWYCQQLDVWEHASFRRTGSRWLKLHGKTCTRPTGSGTWHGGTPHGH